MELSLDSQLEGIAVHPWFSLLSIAQLCVCVCVCVCVSQAGNSTSIDKQTGKIVECVITALHRIKKRSYPEEAPALQLAKIIHHDHHDDDSVAMPVPASSAAPTPTQETSSGSGGKAKDIKFQPLPLFVLEGITDAHIIKRPQMLNVLFQFAAEVGFPC